MAVDRNIGRTLGNVKLIKCIGRGAMGVVYRGWHETLSRDVAVKMLLNSERKNSRERFLREAKASAKVRHPNVVQILDAGDDNGVAYLVMELVDGHSLGSIIDDTGALSPEVVARLATGIARGLAAIHSCGIIHRDIKPDNILVAQDGVPKITDLGLAKQHDDPDLLRLTATGVVVGTPLYVSPEAIRDPKSLTCAADIYSLGATFYHMLTGKPPFDSDSSYEVMRAQLESRPRPIRELKPQVPIGLCKLVDRCLEKSPTNRPTAPQLADILDRGARIQPGANRGLIIAIIVSIIAVILLAWGAWSWVNKAPPPPAIPANSHLSIRANQTPARVRIDNGSWELLGTDSFTLSAGRHSIEVVLDRSGPLLSYRQDIVLSEREEKDLRVILSTTTLPSSTRVPPPGPENPDMVYLEGIGIGPEKEVIIPHAGTYSIGSLKNGSWASMTATITTDGKCSVSPIKTGDIPDGNAWWSTHDKDNKENKAIQPHHIISWFEANYMRSTARIQEPRNWQNLGIDRLNTQLKLDTSFTLVLAKQFQETWNMRLPNVETATELASINQSGVWYQTDDERPNIDVIGGPKATALLIVTPK